MQVMGTGNTRDEADADHDRNLRELQKRCAERNILLNDEKSVLKQTQVKFIGHLVITEGAQADQSKVEAILNMPAPSDVHGVKRLCGMIQYLKQSQMRD